MPLRSHESEQRELSLVIPIGPQDESWRGLLSFLASLPQWVEILFVGTDRLQSQDEEMLFQRLAKQNFTWCISAPGRAAQLNKGAELANASFIWFLHADSIPATNCLAALDAVRLKYRNALFYFNLSFDTDGPKLMWINSLGVWIRSHLLGIPFGDQGFALSRQLFFELGGYSTEVDLGEDHHFVWKAKRSRVPLRCTGASICTSARKYREEGWCKVTLFHLYHTLRQATSYLLGSR